MKVVMLNSPIYRESTSTDESYLPPLGLGYIVSELRRQGIEANLVDCVRLHLGVEETIDAVCAICPDFMGANLFTQNHDLVKNIVEQSPSNVNWLLGGPAAKSIYSSIMDWNTSASLQVVIGEAELIVPSLVLGRCVERPVLKVGNRSVYKVGTGSVYFPHDINLIRLDRKVFSPSALRNHYGKVEEPIVTSRGCMYDCAFCGGARSLNRDTPIRRRSTDNISEEIGSILDNNREVSSIRVLDDLFLRDRTSVVESISLFSRFPSLSWRGMAHVLTFSNALDLLAELKESGCQELFIGIESGSDRIRQKINKLGDSTLVRDTLCEIMKAGIDVKGYFMYGLPDETEDDARETFKLAEELSVCASRTAGSFRLSVFQFRPYHGTKLYNQILSNGGTIGAMTNNMTLNESFGRRSQFNFQSGNYSKIEDSKLNSFILRTQALSA